MNISLSADDEKRFKVRAARADVEGVDDVAEVLRFCREQRVVLLMVRCPVSEVRTVQALEDAGLRMMDTLVTFARPLDGWVPTPAKGIEVAPLRDGEAGIVTAIAREAFHNYAGHYHADPHLDPAECDELYVDWASRCASGELADVVLLARIDGAPAGFMAIRVRGDEADLWLSGVARAFTSRGVFQSFIATGMTWMKERGVKTVVLPTQISNVAVRRSCSKLGLLPTNSVYTLHGWFAE